MTDPYQDLLTFLPWIGAEYGEDIRSIDDGIQRSGQLDRVHLMGESHYSDEPADPGFTRRAVRNLALERNSGSAFWTKAIQLFEHKPASEINLQLAWQKVAFSNFMQDVLSAPRDGIPSAYWERGRAAFFKQLGITRPTVLVSMSKRLFDELPMDGARVPWALKAHPDWEPVTDAWLYDYDTPSGRQLTVAVKVNHPSAPGFRWEEAARRVSSVRHFYSNIAAAYVEGEFGPLA